MPSLIRRQRAAVLLPLLILVGTAASGCDLDDRRLQVEGDGGVAENVSTAAGWPGGDHERQRQDRGHALYRQQRGSRRREDRQRGDAGSRQGTPRAHRNPRGRRRRRDQDRNQGRRRNDEHGQRRRSVQGEGSSFGGRQVHYRQRRHRVVRAHRASQCRGHQRRNSSARHHWTNRGLDDQRWR